MGRFKIEYELGCLMNDKSKLTFLIEVDPIKKKSRVERRAIFLCECGNTTETNIRSVKYGDTVSCGCSYKGAGAIHGLTNHPLYNTYRDMLRRCYNTKRSDFKHYGGRGIEVCDRWTDSETGLQNFISDVGEKPAGFELDRIDVNGNYEPSNVQWADRSNQCYNRRISQTNSSGFVGVIWHKASGKWNATITHNYNRIALGSYENIEDAVKARRDAEIEYFGYHPNYGEVEDLTTDG